MLAQAVFTEPIAVSDVFASGLAEVEDLQDGNYRFTFFARRRSLDYSGAIESEVVARLIIPSNAVIEGMKRTMEAMGIRCCGGEKLRYLSH